MWISQRTDNGDIFSAAVKCISDYGEMPKSAEQIAFILATPEFTHNESDIMETIKIFSSKTIKDCILRFKENPDVAKWITYDLWSIQSHTGSKKAVLKSVDCISKFEAAPQAAGRIASCLCGIAQNTSDAKRVKRAAKKILNAENPEKAAEIAEYLELVTDKGGWNYGAISQPPTDELIFIPTIIR